MDENEVERGEHLLTLTDAVSRQEYIDAFNNKGNAAPLKKVSAACTICKKDHASCDSGRPCRRCVTRGTADLCQNGESKKRGPKKMSPSELSSKRLRVPESETSPSGPYFQSSPASSESNGSYLPNLAHPNASFDPSSSASFGSSSPSYSNPLNTQSPIARISENVMDLLPSLEGGENILNWLWMMEGFDQSDGSPKAELPFQSTPANNTQETEEDLPSLYIKPDDWLQKTHEILFQSCIRKGMPLENIWTLEEMRERQAKLRQIKDFVTPDQKKVMKLEYESTLQSFQNTCLTIAVPTIVWDRTGVIHCANEGYVELTSFDRRLLPSKIGDYLIMELVSKTTASNIVAMLKSLVGKPDIKSGVIDGEGRIWGDNNTSRQKYSTTVDDGSRYIQGQIYFTIKRDFFGIPMLFMTHFFPYPIETTFTKSKSAVSVLENLLSTGKIDQAAYLKEKNAEREQKEKKILALKERLKDPDISPTMKESYQKRLDDIELS